MQKIAEKLTQLSTVKEKTEFLSELSSVKLFLEAHPEIVSFLEGATAEQKLVLKAAVAAGQGERLFIPFDGEKVLALLKQLITVEEFYSSMGGIVGYQARIVALLSPEKEKKPVSTFLAPEGIHIAVENGEVKKAIVDGIAMMPMMSEMYALGGAADRLRLYDEKTGVALPAARLPFLGITLLEGLIRDLQSREYLYYKIFGQQIMTPVAIMTSEEKNNHHHILEICEEADWFGRPKESFQFFCQPLVPTINRKGEWCLLGPMHLLLKPGGHGVIWHLADQEGVFDWFFEHGRKKALIRQVNNPVANTDYGLIAFTGIGCGLDKRFGFASCPRQVKAAEGVDILMETPTDQGYQYTLTNIEYTDFQKMGIIDQSENPGSPYSKFPSNTNILFADLHAVQEKARENPIPGVLVNLKKVSFRTDQGQKKEEAVARLESTMQNIADLFSETFDHALRSDERHHLQTFLTYNHRRKTISAIKREFTLGSSLLETPEGCFLDILKNSRELLVERCDFQVPQVSDPLHFFEKGPSFIFTYHPALGPLYSVIAQKLRGGQLHVGSELQLHIAEADIENLVVEGSLLIQAENVMGKGEYSEAVGRCHLKNVTVVNKGIDLDMHNVYWRAEIARQEVCQIILRGRSEFFAENLTLKGDHFIEVPDGERCVATEEQGEVHFRFEPIDAPTWHWKYHVDEHQNIVLALVSGVKEVN